MNTRGMFVLRLGCSWKRPVPTNNISQDTMYRNARVWEAIMDREKLINGMTPMLPT